MPSDKFPTQDPKPVLTNADFEKLVKVKTEISMAALMDWLKEGRFVRFIMTPEFDLILSHAHHEELVARMHIDRHSLIIPDGDLLFDGDSHSINFVYSWHSFNSSKVPGIHEFTENKIKELLKKQGIHFDRSVTARNY
jgi:hypothetical protein